MNKIIYGWLVFLTLPITIIGYSKIVEIMHVVEGTRVLLFIFALAVTGFQFVMTCSFMLDGWKELGTKNPFN